MYTVNPNQGEFYFVCLMLNVMKGPRSLKDLKTVDGQLCEMYRHACQLLRLLEDDNHLEHMIEEPSLSQLPAPLRTMFATIMIHCKPCNPAQLWTLFKNHLAEDFLHQHRCQFNDPSAPYTHNIYNKCLCAVEDKMQLMGGFFLHI